jgi:ribonuclease P protein component
MSGGQNNIDGRVTMRRLRLPRTAILRGKKAFAGLFDGGSFLRGRYIDFKYALRPSGTGNVRVAFIAGKRLGNAVVRNRCKRLTREAYRLTQHQFGDLFSGSGMDLEAAFIAKGAHFGLDQYVEQMHHIVERLKSRALRSDENAV